MGMPNEDEFNKKERPAVENASPAEGTEPGNTGLDQEPQEEEIIKNCLGSTKIKATLNAENDPQFSEKLKDYTDEKAKPFFSLKLVQDGEDKNGRSYALAMEAKGINVKTFAEVLYRISKSKSPDASMVSAIIKLLKISEMMDHIGTSSPELGALLEILGDLSGDGDCDCPRCTEKRENTAENKTADNAEVKSEERETVDGRVTYTENNNSELSTN